MEAKDTSDEKIYAIKVIRAVPRYTSSAKIEANVIKTLNKADPDHQSHIVRLHDTFTSHNNFCLVFEKLGKNLYEVIKESGYKGFPMRIVKEFTRQIFKAVGFMHG